MKVPVLIAASAVVAMVSTPAFSVTYLQRLVAEFQNSTSLGPTGEVLTNAPAGPMGSGGTVVYDKALTLDSGVDVLFITFSGQADTHDGSALLMTATVNGNVIEPLAGQNDIGGGGPHLQTGWYTLSHLPAGAGVQNCNDGGGGSADCHDNAIYFSGCYALGPNDPEHNARVQIKLADLPGTGNNISFYERATVYIDGQREPGDNQPPLCRGVSTQPH